MHFSTPRSDQLTHSGRSGGRRSRRPCTSRGQSGFFTAGTGPERAGGASAFPSCFGGDELAGGAGARRRLGRPGTLGRGDGGGGGHGDYPGSSLLSRHVTTMAVPATPRVRVPTTNVLDARRQHEHPTSDEEAAPPERRRLAARVGSGGHRPRRHRRGARHGRMLRPRTVASCLASSGERHGVVGARRAKPGPRATRVGRPELPDD